MLLKLLNYFNFSLGLSLITVPVWAGSGCSTNRGTKVKLVQVAPAKSGKATSTRIRRVPVRSPLPLAALAAPAATTADSDYETRVLAAYAAVQCAVLAAPSTDSTRLTSGLSDQTTTSH